MDAQTGVGIPGVAIGFEREKRRREVLSDTTGHFAVRDLAPGMYAVSLTTLGYRADLPRFEVSAEPAFLEIRMLPDPVALTGLRVQVERQSPYLRDQGFYHRRERGHGSFVTPDDVRKLRPVHSVELLRRVPSIRILRTATGYVPVVNRGGSGYMNREGRCVPSIVVDGRFARVRNNAYGHPFDRVVPPPEMIDAIEVYAGPATVPMQWRGGTTSCGVIVVWTKR